MKGGLPDSKLSPQTYVTCNGEYNTGEIIHSLTISIRHIDGKYQVKLNTWNHTIKSLLHTIP